MDRNPNHLTGVDAVGHRDVDQAVGPADGHHRLGALLRERVQARARAAAEDDGEHRRRGGPRGDGGGAAGDGRALDDGAGGGGAVAAAAGFDFLCVGIEKKKKK